jgi:hypothetical protein
MLAAIAGMGAALCVPAAAAAASAPASAAAAQSWYRAVLADLTPLQSSLIGSLQAVDSWQDGHGSAAKVRQEVHLGLPPLKTALQNVSHVAPLPGYAEAKSNFVDGINLYVQSYAIIRAATQVRSAALVKQLQRASTRIRELGDVTFDQGTAQMASLLGSTLAGDDVQAATQIPDWSAQDLAPGEPLVSQWKGIVAQPSLTQSAAGWINAINMSGAPTQVSVNDAAKGRHHVSAVHLVRLAVELDRAEVALSATPGLIGHPQASSLLRIALLVDAESVLAQEASQLFRSAPAAQLAEVARALAVVGGSLRQEQ